VVGQRPPTAFADQRHSISTDRLKPGLWTDFLLPLLKQVPRS